MLRILVRTPRRRLAWLVLAVALAWTAWALWPPAPEAGWSLPMEEGNQSWFTPDGRTVLTARFGQVSSPNGTLVYSTAGPLVGRDAETGRERYRRFESVQSFGMIRMTPDGRRLTMQANLKGQVVTDPADLTDLLVLDPADGRQLAALANVNCQFEKFQGLPRPHFIDAVDPVSSDGRWLAYRRRGDDDLHVYDLESGRDGPTLQGARPPAAFSPDGRTLAAQTPDYRVGFWDVATGATHPAPADRGPEVLAVGLWFAPDGRTLSAIYAVDAPFGKPAAPSSWPPGTALKAVALWDVTTGARRPDPPPPARGRDVVGVSFSPDSRFLAVPAFPSGWLWDLAADPPVVVQLTPAGPPPPAEWSYLPALLPDGSALAAAGPRELALFDPVTRERRQTFRLGHKHILGGDGFRFSPDGRVLLVGYSTGTWLSRLPEPVRHWLTRYGTDPSFHAVTGTFDVATGRQLRSVESTFGPPARLKTYRMYPFAPDGRSFWMVKMPARDRRTGQLGTGPVLFERWSVDPPGWPWGMIALTMGAVGLAVVDRLRRRGAAPRRV
jgi:WD40 repeat protein